MIIEIVQWKKYSQGPDVWVPTAQVQTAFDTIDTIGYQIKADSVTVTIGQSYDEATEAWGCILNIPVVDIVARKTVDKSVVTG
jgi:hypothetical protein